MTSSALSTIKTHKCSLTLLVNFLDGIDLGIGAATHDLHKHLVLGAKTLSSGSRAIQKGEGCKHVDQAFLMKQPGTSASTRSNAKEVCTMIGLLIAQVS